MPGPGGLPAPPPEITKTRAVQFYIVLLLTAWLGFLLLLMLVACILYTISCMYPLPGFISTLVIHLCRTQPAFSERFAHCAHVAR